MPHNSNNSPDSLSPFSFTVKQASAHLAEVAVIGRRLREKTAAGGLMETVQPYLDQAKGYAGQAGDMFNSTVKNIANPQTNGWEAARNGLIGAAGGAGLGAITSFGQPRGRRRTLSSMLQGALLGGAIGGGGTLALQQASLAGKLPDSAISKRLEAIAAELKRNTVRGSTAGNAALAAEQADLQARLKALPPPAPAGPPKPQASTLRVLDSAATDVMSGQPGEAAATLFPHPGKAMGGAALGGGIGYGTGKAVETGLSRAYLGNRVKDMNADELHKVLGDFPATHPTLAKQPIAPVVQAELNAAKSNLLGAKPITPALKSQTGILRGGKLHKAAPRIGRGWLPRIGAAAGTLIGSRWGQQQPNE